MSPPSLRAHYLHYLDELNSHADRPGWKPDLAAFVGDELHYNDRPLARATYEALISDSVNQLPGLRYHPITLVVDEESKRVACRLEFIVIPKDPYMGVAAGQRMRFYEHVFYDFEDGRIVRVHAVFSTPEVLAT